MCVADIWLSRRGLCVALTSVALLLGPRDVAVWGWTFAIGHGRIGCVFVTFGSGFSDLINVYLVCFTLASVD